MTVLVPTAASHASYDRPKTDQVDENYLTGFLIWNAGVGAVTWDGAAATETYGGGFDLTRTARSVAGGFLLQNGGTDGGSIPFVEFVGQPLPRSMYLNVTRMIQVDLFARFAGNRISGVETGGLNQCNGLLSGGPGLQLYAGDAFLGGSLWMFPRSDLNAPKAPAGHCAFAFRFYPELDNLTAGIRLTLRIVMYSKYPADANQDGLEFLMKGDVRSLLRLAFYPEKDALVRIPELALELDSTNPRSDAADDSPALEGLMILSLVFFGRRHSDLANRRKATAMSLIVLGAVAGCLEPARPEDGAREPDRDTSAGYATSSLLPDESSGDSRNSTFGKILGVLQDDLSTPVSGAHVSLLGTSEFTRSDSLGRFFFQNLTPATYQIRIDHRLYKSMETNAVVHAGHVTRLSIELAPIVARGMLPHRHDYWAGKMTKTFLETDVFIGERCVQVWMAWPIGPGCEAHPPLPTGTLSEPSIILPGTYDVEVKIDWDPLKNQVPWILVGFVANHDRNWTGMFPKRNGESTHIRTSWEMTDVGHQQFSMWELGILLPAHGIAHANSMSGPFHVKIILHRGVVPLEPPHAEFWGSSQSRLEVLESAVLKVECPGSGEFSRDCPSPREYPHAYAMWPVGKIIPPGTDSIIVTFDQDKETVPSPYNWGVLYKPGNVAPSAAFGDYRPLPVKEERPRHKVYELKLGPGEADPYYAKAYAWRFALDDGVTGVKSVANGPIQFVLNVTAFRSATPTADES